MKFTVKENAKWYQLVTNTLKTIDQVNRRRFLEDLADYTYDLMKLIFNKFFNNEEIQKDWKNAGDLPVATKGKQDDPGNYGLFSMAYVLGKIMENQ